MDYLTNAFDDYLCPTEVDGFKPYYQSEFDAWAWRTGLPELLYLESWIPFSRRIGQAGYLNSWGNVMPRQGFVLQREHGKAGAVMAQRAIDIITRKKQPHVYSFFADISPENERINLEISPSDEKTDFWLMLGPSHEHRCQPFGDVDLDLPTYAQERIALDGRYGWLYWPKYACCVPHKTGIPLGYTNFSEICLT